MQTQQESPSLDDLISRTEAMKLLGLSRNWFIAREGNGLTVYKPDGMRMSHVYYDKREVMALFKVTQEQQADNAAA